MILMFERKTWVIWAPLYVIPTERSEWSVSQPLSVILSVVYYVIAKIANYVIARSVSDVAIPRTERMSYRPSVARGAYLNLIKNRGVFLDFCFIILNFLTQHHLICLKWRLNSNGMRDEQHTRCPHKNCY